RVRRPSLYAFPFQFAERRAGTRLILIVHDILRRCVVASLHRLRPSEPINRGAGPTGGGRLGRYISSVHVSPGWLLTVWLPSPRRPVSPVIVGVSHAAVSIRCCVEAEQTVPVEGGGLSLRRDCTWSRPLRRGVHRGYSCSVWSGRGL